jgi:hypothetical protein
MLQFLYGVNTPQYYLDSPVKGLKNTTNIIIQLSDTRMRMEPRVLPFRIRGLFYNMLSTISFNKV